MLPARVAVSIARIKSLLSVDTVLTALSLNAQYDSLIDRDHWARNDLNHTIAFDAIAEGFY